MHLTILFAPALSYIITHNPLTLPVSAVYEDVLVFKEVVGHITIHTQGTHPRLDNTLTA